MKKLLLLLFAMCLVSVEVSGQKSETGLTVISGIVKDKNENIPLEMVTVRLLQAKDSAFVKGGGTDHNGLFTLSSIKAGNYLLSLSYLGYNTLFLPVKVTAQQPKTELGVFSLVPGNIELQEAVVVGKAPEVVVKEDTIEYNASSYKAQSNAVVEDLLKKLPGVEVSAEGKITAGGKEIKKILVDGEEFFSNDPKVASKNIPANIIDKLQVVDRKSDLARLTGVDDGEEETVINLSVKKGMKKSWFGDIQVGAGNKKRYELNGMVNRFVDTNQYTLLGSANNTNNMGFSDLGGNMYSGNSRRRSGGNGINTSSSIGGNFNVGKSEKLRVGGDVMYSSSDLDNQQRSQRQNLFKDSISYYDSESKNRTRSQNISMNVRLRWMIDSVSTLEFMPRFGFNKTKVSDGGSSATRAGNLDSINSGLNNSYGQGNGYDLSGRLSFSRKSKTKAGRQLSLSFDYSMNNAEEKGTNYSHNYFYLNDSISLADQETDDRNWSNSYRVRASYVEPIFTNRFLTFSYQYRYNTNNADRMVYDLLNEYEIDSLYSNRFRNIFQTHEINASFKTVRPKYTYDIGLNLNPSTSRSENLIDSSRNVPARSVFNLSPVANFTYMFEKRTTLRFTYRGRTRQPSLSQLQPVKNITNPLNISEGNPDLKPSYSNDIRLRFNSYKTESQQSIMAVLSGSFTLNSIVNKTTYNAETGVQRTAPVNVNGVWNVRGTFMYSTPFANKKFQINSYSNIGYNNNIGFNNGERNRSGNLNLSENLGLDYRSSLFDAGVRGNYSYSLTNNSVQSKKDQEVMNFGGSFNTNIYLPWNIVVASDINYTGSQGYAAGYDRNQWIWNAQVSVSCLSGKQLTFMFKVYDILQQRSNISRNITGNYIQDVEYNTLTSYGMLYVAYRFNTMGKGGKGETARDIGYPDPSQGRKREGGRPSRPVGVF